jgi:hypothetical protein
MEIVGFISYGIFYQKINEIQKTKNLQINNKLNLTIALILLAFFMFFHKQGSAYQFLFILIFTSLNLFISMSYAYFVITNKSHIWQILMAVSNPIKITLVIISIQFVENNLNVYFLAIILSQVLMIFFILRFIPKRDFPSLNFLNYRLNKSTLIFVALYSNIYLDVFIINVRNELVENIKVFGILKYVVIVVLTIYTVMDRSSSPFSRIVVTHIGQINLFLSFACISFLSIFLDNLEFLNLESNWRLFILLVMYSLSMQLIFSNLLIFIKEKRPSRRIYTAGILGIPICLVAILLILPQINSWDLVIFNFTLGLLLRLLSLLARKEYNFR